MGKDILVVGSLNMDMVIGVQRMPLVGETILGRGLSYIPGGKGANQACAIGKLGGSVAMLGSVGQDEFGAALSGSLAGAGVDTSRLKQCGDLPTGTAVIYVDGQGKNSIVVVAGANGACDESYIMENDHLLQACRFVVLQMEIPLETINRTISRAKELGKTVVLNPAPAPDSLPEALYRQIDFLTPNETELMKLAGPDVSGDLEGLARGAGRLLEKGVGHVLVTLGEKGALLVDKGGAKAFPTRKVAAVDTTAAGDCFNGAFVLALCEGRDIPGAIAFANAASSVAVTRKGAQVSLPCREEAQAALAETNR